MTLLIVSQSAGILVILGSLFLLWKRKIYLDAEGKEVTDIEFPLGFKVKTNTPVLVMIFFGVFLIALPLLKPSAAEVEKTTVCAQVTSKGPVTAYAIVDFDETDGRSETVQLTVPLLEGQEYRVVYIPKALNPPTEKVNVKAKECLRGVDFTNEPTPASVNIEATRQEPANVVSGFKE
jgi:hypothetical protein